MLYLTKTYDGIPELLGELKKAGVKTAVLSNKPHNVAHVVVEELFGKAFDAVWGKKPEFPAKPDPCAALNICRMLGVEPKDAVFAGDTCVDIETGKNGGFYTVGVLWGFRERKELVSAGADALAEKAADILKYIL